MTLTGPITHYTRLLPPAQDASPAAPAAPVAPDVVAKSPEDIKIGSTVKVKSGTTPSTGWGNVKAGSVGTVKEITGGGKKCRIDFPEQSNWVGVIAELEIMVSMQVRGMEPSIGMKKCPEIDKHLLPVPCLCRLQTGAAI